MDALLHILHIVVDKLPDWYLMLLIPVAAWYFSRLRPKKGKDGVRSWRNGFYFYRDSVEQERQNLKLGLILKDVSDIKLRVDDIEIEQLKAKAYNKSLPIGERIACGIKAILHGVNGDFKTYINEKLRPGNEILYDELYKVLAKEVNE